MAIAEQTGEELTELHRRVQLRRAVVASSVGSIIEAYDFLLYGQVTGLVFGKLYFPHPTRWWGRGRPSASTRSALPRGRSVRPSLVISAIVSDAKRH